MRRMRLAIALRAGNAPDEHATVLDAHIVHGNAVLFEARLALTGAAVELPEMPRTRNVIAVERPFPERAADVIADARDRAELAVPARERNARASQQHLSHGLRRELFARPHIDP